MLQSVFPTVKSIKTPAVLMLVPLALGSLLLNVGATPAYADHTSDRTSDRIVVQGTISVGSGSSLHRDRWDIRNRYDSSWHRGDRQPYVVNGEIDDSTLVNPVIINSSIEDSTLINPVIITRPRYSRPTVRTGRTGSCLYLSSMRAACQR
jgi:hypothetical protein